VTLWRCLLCISDPATRFDKLWQRRAIIWEKIQQLQDLLYLVNSEIVAITGEDR